MGFCSSSSLHLLVILSLLLAISCVSAQKLVAGTNNSEFNGSTKSLDRRSKMVFETTSLGSDSPGLRVFDAFFASLSMILVSEIGDETFIIAALMAMRQPKSIILCGALSALFVMTVLSTELGRIVPHLISRKHTNSVAIALYASFGLRLIYYAWGSDCEDSNKKEIEEVEEKLESGKGKTPFLRIFSPLFTPIFLESFILTFLAEWGDRSQIAMISLATNKNAIGVAVGAILGHTICTTLAVVGGSMLASKISPRIVATMGGLLFLGFSISSFIYPPV